MILGFTLFSSCCLNYYLGQYYAFITVIIVLILIYHSTSLRWLNLSCALFGYLFTVTMNYVCIWIAQSYLNMSLDQMYENPFVILLFSFFYCILCYLGTFLLGYVLNIRLRIGTLLTDIHLCIAIFIAMLLITAFFIFNFSYGESIGYSYGVIAFNGILFLALFIAIATLMWFLYQNIQQKQAAKHMLWQYEHLQSYTKKIEELYNSMRGFRHDYVNVLSTLSGYINDNDMPHLKDYFYNEILPASQTITKSDTKLGSLAQIQILELKSLLSSKLIYAMGLNIEVDLELSETIADIPMKIVDLARILGIFLDNAIEAALVSDEKLIQVCFLRKEDCLMIILRNSSSSPVLPLSKLTDWGISNKDDHPGIGLHNAKNILNGYHHVLWEMQYEQPFFTQTLTIYQERKDNL